MRSYKDWQQLIQNPEIDIVSIATPAAFAVEIAFEAMRAGKHVLLEKPITLDNQGAEDLLKTQNKQVKSL